MPIPTCTFRRVLLCGLLTALIILMGASGARAAGGENAAAFLSIDVGARALGMGGAFVPIANDETCLFWNPAALGLIEGPSFGATHTEWYQELQFEWAGTVTPVGQRCGTGVAATLLHSAPIAGYDEAGQPTGDFTVRDLAVTAGWGVAVAPGLAVGATVKGIQQSIAGEAVMAYAGDVGVLAGLAGWRFAALVRNIGPEVSYDSDAYPLPFGAIFGVARPLAGHSLLSAEFAGGRDGAREARVGAEWTWNRLLSVRTGYRSTLNGGDPSDGMTAGAGLRRPAWSLDYALTPHRDLGAAHRFSFSLRFGGARTEMPGRLHGFFGLRKERAAGGPGFSGYSLYTTSRHARIESANAEVRSLVRLGFDEARVIPEGPLYRVLAGFYLSREEAEKQGEVLRESGFETEVTGT